MRVSASRLMANLGKSFTVMRIINDIIRSIESQNYMCRTSVQSSLGFLNGNRYITFAWHPSAVTLMPCIIWLHYC